ncbi:Aldo/keto reductase [Athelia psychrophila]|uniref:Aldo/keto reductase n=1 Tax=Athelia psychrophila TaxID=1759441 RepID=A0A165WL77_9AGAM|nr:Aldo/keto reductase [Fibularhizoctonia sp. CBS 109695]
MSFPTRKIGQTEVSAMGYGAMGISGFYGENTQTDEERFAVRTFPTVLDAVYANGCKFIDTSDVYGDNEELIGKWLKRTGNRADVFIATKFGITEAGANFGPDAEPARAIDGRPEYVRAAVEKSLAQLGVDCIDLYYAHRVDPLEPIENTVGAMAELVKAGKVKYLGISECSAATLRRAHAVHPIAALQVEYSPFTLGIEDPKVALLQTARELGVTIIAYSPLGRGLLTGRYKSPDDFGEGDFRRLIPRYSHENFPNILKLAAGLKDIGTQHGATAGQVSLAWLLAQGDDVIPIPGTSSIKYLQENLGAAKIQLTPEDLLEVRKVAEIADGAQGRSHYPVGAEAQRFGNTPEL